MTRIILDEAMRAKLQNLKEPLELCDESGRALARVLPIIDLTGYDLTEPPISEEELQRIERSDKWYTTNEVLERLSRMSES